MKRIRIYRNPACARCARMHQRLDWLGRVEVTTHPPPGRAPLKMGEIVVEHLGTRSLLEGIDAVRAIALQIPAYFPLRLLLRFPALARRADLEARGLSGRCDQAF
jgi:hypothetical protein